MTAAQLGLFADTRLVDGLTCIRDAVPQAMEIVIHLADWHLRAERGNGYSNGDWLYSVRREGLYYEPARGFGEHRPAHLIPWDELTGLLGDDPRRPYLIAWSQSLTAVDAWYDRARPHELWPKPWMWHRSYIDHDHERDGWDQRIAAWRTLYAILDDAIARLDGAAV